MNIIRVIRCSVSTLYYVMIAKLLFSSQNDSYDEGSLFESEEFTEEQRCHIVSYSWADIWAEFLQVIKGTSDSLPRTANVAHALGNVTVGALNGV